jgi:hypothetical protein
MPALASTEYLSGRKPMKRQRDKRNPHIRAAGNVQPRGAGNISIHRHADPDLDAKVLRGCGKLHSALIWKRAVAARLDNNQVSKEGA